MKLSFKFANLTLTKAILLLGLSLTAACGRETKIYDDPKPDTGTQDVPPSIIIEPHSLPNGFFDQSVNQAIVDLALDGDNKVAVRMKTTAQTQSAGGFNGSGEGNRALLGLGKHFDSKLSELSSISFDRKVIDGTEPLTVLLSVDLQCDGKATRLLVADEQKLETGAIPQADDYSRINAEFDQELWSVSGQAIVDPNDATVELVSSTSVAKPKSLTKFMQAYPKACVKNAKTQDDGLPKNLTTAGILISLGTPDTKTTSTTFINRISVGKTVYDASEWVKP
jgi:hypothetical protein